MTFGEKPKFTSGDADVKSELSSPTSDSSRNERPGDIPQSTNEPIVAGSSQIEVSYRTTTEPVSSTGECVSNGDQRHNVSSGNIKATKCLACNIQFNSEKRLKQHLTASVKCSSQLAMPTRRLPYNAAPSSSEPNHESSSKLHNDLHTLPGASGSFSHNQVTRTPTRVTLAVRPIVSASVTTNTEAMSYSAPYIVEEKRPTKRKRSSNLTCGNCKKQFDTSDEFLLHTMKRVTCFSHYEIENTEVTVPYCFKCKRSFQTYKLCIKHKCLGLVEHQCPQCGGIFCSIYSLRNHESSTHKRK